MPSVKHRKVQVTIEFAVSSTGMPGETADLVTRPLEMAARDLVKTETGVSAYKVMTVHVESSL
jgi:hypothetical protein